MKQTGLGNNVVRPQLLVLKAMKVIDE